ncbi:MAG: hypothetical protein CLLPBCKN_005872 [Chroococcidiopsis cubana SAG 39.79]|jgi:chloramphenicol 3-O-phosphotransferase|uniref:Uncharacterized protein n=2 Tax=Chroococcidiopsis TaxID=54298 RepID=K9U666_CHRTP|nr:MULTISPECIES: CTB family bacteriocin [Chroococcidiopsis]AFY90290.1 hypothetical protein Chro_4911 [Chroococcidiopsis thermalis PCC 7203]MDZ4876452.1 hypothetical protein [Chroococcidiopsis cubana SAG 39.79]RUT01404.1 hypothetical protein DSM107010_65620 [Chroococcidiopsis cubana SAG 39.79]URD49686.1 CTB family bacteriocin [Chroococcidiopsis sp. CCNUC1]
MINETNTELFVELSDEQQQLVAGGYSYPGGGDGQSIYDILNTSLKENKSVQHLKVGIASTRDGSYVEQDYLNANHKFETDAFKYFTAK